MNDYFKPREGLHALNVDLHNRSCKIAFLGNSITAQKGCCAYQLTSQINNYFSPTHEFVYAGIGGIGSFVSCFLMDNFVVRYQLDICFVECTVTEIGYATPPQLIKPAVESMIRKLIASSVQIIFQNISISLSKLDSARRGSNGSANKFIHTGSSWNLISLMAAYTQEPSVKTKLW